MTTSSTAYYAHPYDFVMRRRWSAIQPPQAPR